MKLILVMVLFNLLDWKFLNVVVFYFDLKNFWFFKINLDLDWDWSFNIEYLNFVRKLI